MMNLVESERMKSPKFITHHLLLIILNDFHQRPKRHITIPIPLHVLALK